MSVPLNGRVVGGVLTEVAPAVRRGLMGFLILETKSQRVHDNAPCAVKARLLASRQLRGSRLLRHVCRPVAVVLLVGLRGWSAEARGV